jgi:acyl-CoA thioester hydrolase
MSSAPFLHHHRVTYADCTVGNHVYYSRYLELLEAARGEYFRHLGRTFLEWQQADVIFPVIECRLRYHAPARYDDVLTIEVRITEAHRIRLNFAYRVLHQAGGLLAVADTFHVCTGLDEKPRRLPEALVQATR